MNESIEERIGRYLAGEADIHEKEALEREIETNPAFREHFLLLQKIWENSDSSSDITWDSEKAWQKFIEKKPTTQRANSTGRTRTLRWSVAALLILAIGASVFLWNGNKTMDCAFDKNGNNQLVLTDGSKIYLNEGASLTVHSFKRKTRKVDLKGEAYFEVSPDPKKPFIVKAGGTVTEVVGTAFNIDQFEDQTSIFVANGKVIFRSQKKDDVAVALTSGEAAVFQNEKIQAIANPSPNMHAWHSKELRFKSMTLGAIIDDVSHYFNYEITFENEEIKNCATTGTLSFKEPQIESVLSSVLATVNANYVMEGTKCTIKGGNCNF